MHICFIAIDFHAGQGGGGVASYISSLGQALVTHGHNVTVLARGSHYQVTSEQGMRIVRVPLGNAHWYLYKAHAPSFAILPVRELEWSWGLRHHFDRLLSETAIDIVEGSEVGSLFLTGQSNNLPPLVIRLHGDPYSFRQYSGQPLTLGDRLYRQLELIALRRAAALTAPSCFQAQALAHALGRSTQAIDVLPNPIDPLFLQTGLGSRAEENHSRPAMVLYTGRIEYVKGILPLLYAAPTVMHAVPDVEFILAGARHTSIDDQTLADTLGADDLRAHIRLIGHVPWRQLPEWYRRATIFVMPSFFETFSISVVEAMACGLPVVATTAGGLPEVVEDGVTGLLVPPGDPQALAEAMIRLLRDARLRKRLGQAGRARVLAEFTVDRVVEQTLAVYAKALAKRHTRTAEVRCASC